MNTLTLDGFGRLHTGDLQPTAQARVRECTVVRVAGGVMIHGHLSADSGNEEIDYYFSAGPDVLQTIFQHFLTGDPMPLSFNYAST